MPWKGEKDPYRIWLSEIILQQTRVNQGLKYYNNYIRKYNTITDLANASDDDVFKDWEGLGYYNRCRNMLFTARYVRDVHNGVFPTTFEEILDLKGVGQYTASAIASFAYGLPHAVVDGNVVRVLSRYLALDQQFVSVADKRFYQEIAQEFLAKRSAGAYNQAIMDFGATLCTPQNPHCDRCPVRKNCQAFALGQIDKYPPKKKKTILKKRTFHYIVLKSGKSIYIRKRSEKGIWQSLYEPILIEQKTKPAWLKNVKEVCRKSQKLSHQALDIRFYILNKASQVPIDIESYQKVSPKELATKAFPKSVYEFLKEFEYI
jgi:A/G-specific adenine glycosylase